MKVSEPRRSLFREYLTVTAIAYIHSAALFDVVGENGIVRNLKNTLAKRRDSEDK